MTTQDPKTAQNKRRAKSDQAKREKGEIRLSIWLTKEASESLAALETLGMIKRDRREIVSQALLEMDKRAFSA